MNNGIFKEIIETNSERNSEKGLTTMELLIAMAIFLVVISSVYGILKIGNQSRSTINSRTDNIKNVRLALNSIGREAINAGLGYNRIGGTVPDDFTNYNFSMPADPDSDSDLLTAISVGHNINGSNLSKSGEKNDEIAFAFRDFQFNNGFPIVITDVQTKNGQLVLKTPNGACANCRPYDLFLIETGQGRQAVILSTDIVDNNQIVLGGQTDPLDINYGKGGKALKKAQKDVDDATKKLADAIKKLTDEQQKLTDAIQKGDTKKIADQTQKVLDAQQAVTDAQQTLAAAQATLASLSNPTNGSTVKKCPTGVTTDCIDYGSTTVTAKKIYLVNYSIDETGTLIRTTLGNNTGATADEQIVKQPIATGVQSLKIKYLMSDGTTTDDPSIANTQKINCNEIIQVEVSITVDPKSDSASKNDSDPITLTSTFSTRNLKYDVY